MEIALVNDGNQKTISRPVEFSGVGLHTNRQVIAILEPARANTGIKILKLDTGALIPADYRYVVDTMYSTVVGTKGGDTVSTIEHFMAALYAMDVDNCIVKVDGPEMPILDGSAYAVAEKISEVGLTELDQERSLVAILEGSSPLYLNSSSITLGASDGLTLDVVVDFPGTLIGRQSLALAVTPETFLKDVAPARTFVVKEQIEMLWSAGLALGGSLDNAVVVDKYKILNEGGLRFSDEFVRHKIIDLIGDFALLGKRLRCNISAYKPGHTINSLAIKEISRLLPDLSADNNPRVRQLL
jgi:UDP-3-O-[3-hydroxymyristoyl] N-acetylglucosamine deacetylase